MSDPLLERVRLFLANGDLLRPDALLLVAVSGGPDSLCLLHLLVRLRDVGGPRLYLAHLDHGLRPEAAAEAAAVRATAEQWAIPAIIERHPVVAQAGDAGLMAAARRVRYAFLASAACALDAHAVAVAHQADDQAETVLLHLLRGAGPAGLRGMRDAVPWEEWGAQDKATARDVSMQPGIFPAPPLPRSSTPPLLRPLLTTARAEIEAYCRTHALAPLRDPSNVNVRYARPRIRMLLRELAVENPQIAAALRRTAATAAADYAFIQAQLDAQWPALANERADAVLLDRARFKALHPALQRYAVRRAAVRLGVAELSFEQVEAARTLVAHVGRAATLAAGLHLAVGHAQLVFARDGSVVPYDLPQLPAQELPLLVPGVTPLGAGWVCVVGDEPPAALSPWWVALDPGALGGPLMLRRRRPGERFRPAGGRGSRKLQDFFVDQHVPRPLRAAWPLLVAADAVLWVAGLRAAEGMVAAPHSQGTIWVGLLFDNRKS